MKKFCKMSAKNTRALRLGGGGLINSPVSDNLHSPDIVTEYVSWVFTIFFSRFYKSPPFKIFTQWMVNFFAYWIKHFQCPIDYNFFPSFYKIPGAWIGMNHILLYLAVLIMPISHIGTFLFFLKHGMGTNRHKLYTQTLLLNMSFCFQRSQL